MASATETSNRATIPLRDAVAVVVITVLLLLVIEGPSIRRSGERMDPGIERTVVLAVGHPAGWLGDRLPFAEAGDRATRGLSPEQLRGTPGSGFADGTARGGGAAPVGPEAFDPEALGERPRPPGPLRRVLVTGDSMVMPLDSELARRLVGEGAVTVRRDAHVGTGISKSGLADWGELSTGQVRRDRPEAVVVWLGANEGFAMGDAECCGAEWAAAYATRARRMMDTYRRDGAARVYWLTLPLPRDGDQARVARTVNAAIAVAAGAARAHVRVLDMARLFTPQGRYRDAMPVGGRDRIVREADGIHVNPLGARLAADAVERALRRDFPTR
jgi:lysophospholipase L1-like esterase